MCHIAVDHLICGQCSNIYLEPCDEDCDIYLPDFKPRATVCARHPEKRDGQGDIIAHVILDWDDGTMDVAVKGTRDNYEIGWLGRRYKLPEQRGSLRIQVSPAGSHRVGVDGLDLHKE
jgi:hypothetical protein